MPKDVLSIDIETFSSVDLTSCGVYAYTESSDFEILLFGYAFGDDPVRVVDLAQGEELPRDVLEALIDPGVIKTAFNANFERVCIARFFKLHLPVEQWRCTMVHALYLGLPGDLDTVAKVLRLPVQKDAAGKNLIRYFSKPCKPTAANGRRTRNLPQHAPEKWEQFIAYCARDVETEREVKRVLERFPVPDKEWRLWWLDQKINDTGVALDRVLVKNAIECDTSYNQRLVEKAVKITGLDNPNSVSQLRQWLMDEGVEAADLRKSTVSKLIKETDGLIKQVLELRQELSKTSVKKYQAMERTVCRDGRVRGLLQFYGASRTGRWAGRLVQIQNLPKNDMPDLHIARQLLRSGNFEALELLYESVPDVLSQLIRTAFVPAPGHRLIISDFSAIEARVVAWLAGEQWRLEVFKSHGKIYEASASQMFKVPIEQITKGSPLRQKGKIAELALGYQGGVGALINMGALDMGLSEEELPQLVAAWRAANPAIVQFWRDVEEAALRAVKDRTSVELHHGLVFSYESDILFIRLPSGRRLSYIKPRIERDEQFGKLGVTYDGTEFGKWTRLRTYGGKLTENIVQAVSRDCLAEALLRLAAFGYRIIFHVHDEVVLEMPIGVGSVKEVEEIMAQPIPWAPGLPLASDGFETDYYRKD